MVWGGSKSFKCKCRGHAPWNCPCYQVIARVGGGPGNQKNPPEYATDHLTKIAKGVKRERNPCRPSASICQVFVVTAWWQACSQDRGLAAAPPFGHSPRYNKRSSWHRHHRHSHCRRRCCIRSRAIMLDVWDRYFFNRERLHKFKYT